jgi:hypothetical protein
VAGEDFTNRNLIICISHQIFGDKSIGIRWIRSIHLAQEVRNQKQALVNILMSLWVPVKCG